MEKRWIFGWILLLFLLIFCLWISFFTQRFFRPTASMLEDAVQASLEQNWGLALSRAEQAREKWQDRRSYTAFLADQSPMDDMDRLFGEMEVFARCRDQEHFAAVCSQLSVLCHAMADAHSLHLWNLL